MRPAFALCLFLVATAVFADEPSITQDGRTWVWCEPLKMYRPEGAGWHFDADRQKWWRLRDQWATPLPSEPMAKVDPDTGKLWRFEGGVWRHQTNEAQVFYRMTYQQSEQQMSCPPGGRSGGT